MNFFDVETIIPALGGAKIPSPLRNLEGERHHRRFVSDDDRVLIALDSQQVDQRLAEGGDLPSFERAGPRSQIYFDPSKLRCALVTCGGLCPGLNDIIRSIVLELYYGYNARNIYGIRYGLQGFIPSYCKNSRFGFIPRSCASPQDCSSRVCRHALKRIFWKESKQFFFHIKICV